MTVRLRLRGFDETVRELKRLSGRQAGQVMRRGLNKSARIIRDEARKDLKARGYDRKTYMSPMVRNQRNPDRHTVRVHVTYRKDQYWLIFLELGAARSVITSRRSGVLGYRYGGQWFTFGERAEVPRRAPRAWLRPAFDQNVSRVLRDLADNIREALVKQQFRNAGP